MKKIRWFKWILYFIIIILLLEVFKRLVSRINFPSNYLVNLILLSLQSLTISCFFYFIVFAFLFRKKISLQKFITVFFASFIILVGTLEFFFTYCLHHPAKIPSGLLPAYRYYYEVYQFRVVQYEKDLIALDDELLYTLKPRISENFKNEEFNTLITTNTKGVRDDEKSLISPEIICIGDSFTMGWGVEQGQSFPEVLEKRTGKKVLNAGISSYGTVREMMLLNRFDTSALKYIIIQYCSNDKAENLPFSENNDKFIRTPTPIYTSMMRTYELSRKYFPGKNYLLISLLWLKENINKIYPLFNLNGQLYTGELNGYEEASSFWRVFLKFYEHFRNVKIIVTDIESHIFHKNNFAKELNGLIKEHENSGGRNNILAIDCTDNLTEQDYFILDHHLNYLGHQKVAEKLMQEIK